MISGCGQPILNFRRIGTIDAYVWIAIGLLVRESYEGAVFKPIERLLILKIAIIDRADNQYVSCVLAEICTVYRNFYDTSGGDNSIK